MTIKIELRAIFMDEDGEPIDGFNLQGSATVNRVAYVFEGVLNTIYQKEQHYGGAWRSQGWMGNLARIMSKVSRLRNMQWRADPMEAASESIDDTLQDLIALSAFGSINRVDANVWGE